MLPQLIFIDLVSVRQYSWSKKLTENVHWKNKYTGISAYN